MDLERTISLVYGHERFSFAWKVQTPPQEFSRLLQAAVLQVISSSNLQDVELHACDVAGRSRCLRLQEIFDGTVQQVHVVKPGMSPSPDRTQAVIPQRVNDSRVSGRGTAGRSAFAKKGGSQLQWMKLMQAGGPANLASDSRTRNVTCDELSKRCSEDEAWTAIDGRVFNITPYLEYHPGGAAELMRGAGNDCSALFREVHPWVSVDMIDRLQIGILDPSSLSTASSATFKDGQPALHITQWRAFPVIRSERKAWNAILLRLDLGGKRKLGLYPGQHLRVRMRLKHRQLQEIQREYTPISDPEAPGFVQLLVKIYPDGVLGPELEKLVAREDGQGDCLELLGPFGNLEYLLGGSFRIGRMPCITARRIVMVAAGSGVTPMLQLLRVMLTEPREKHIPSPGPLVTLIYCNRHEDDILMREGLEKMSEGEAAWFRLRLILSRPPANSATWRSGGCSAAAVANSSVHHHEGHISAPVLSEALFGHFADETPVGLGQVFVLCCGPEKFNHATKDMLQGLGVDGSRVHVF